jgi:hypothetical protein
LADVDTANEIIVVVSETGGSGDTEAERPRTLGTEGMRLMQGPKTPQAKLFGVPCAVIVTLELAEVAGAPATTLILAGLVEREKKGTVVAVA